MNLSDPISTIIPSLEGSALRVLVGTTSALTGRRIAELATEGSYQGLLKALNRLVDQGVVHGKVAGGSTLFSINRDHILWPAIEHAVTQAEHALDTMLERLSHSVEGYVGKNQSTEITLALFGSVARRDSDTSSDIDVVAIFPGRVLSQEDEALVDGISADVKLWTGNDCNVYSITDARLREMVGGRDPIIDSWIAEAITFHGPELRRRMQVAPVVATE